MTAINQKEYLKKYLSGHKDGKKKKKHKKKAVVGDRVTIIDDDIDISTLTSLQEAADLFNTNEDAPQVVGVIDERPMHLRINDYRNELWKPLGAQEDDNSEPINTLSEQKEDEINSRQKINLTISSKHQKRRDESPIRKLKRNKRDDPSSSSQRYSDGSPPRKVEKNQYTRDDSPPSGEHKKDDTSPPRRSRRDSEKSPPRKRDVDNSPPRRSKNESDFSPPRKRTVENSPPRRSRRDPDSRSPRKRDVDNSPPRRNKNKSDFSPPRKRTVENSPPKRSGRDSDSSPPRRNRSNSNSSLSRQNRREVDSSPPRRKRENFDNSPPRKLNLKKESDGLPRKNRRDDDISPPRRSRKDSYNSPPRKYDTGPSSSKSIEQPQQRKLLPGNKKGKYLIPAKRTDVNPQKMTQTLDGKTAGLQNKNELVKENEAFVRRENEVFKNMSSDISGANAAPILRDRKTGKIRDLQKEAEEHKEKEKQEVANKEKYTRWGRGLKQVEAYEDKLSQDLHEMNKPLARYADDEDLEKYLKEQEREGDPMLAYIRKKKKKKIVESGKPLKPQYEGEFMPNRFGIVPGYRWDGVDRSNGYEKKWFQVQNAKRAEQEEIYKWSTEDM